MSTLEQSAVDGKARDASHVAAGSALPIVLLAALGAALRIFEIGRRSLWLDEAASRMLARTDWHTFVTAVLHRQANMSLYYILLRGWIHVGAADGSLRLLSVVFGVASIPLMYQMALAIFGIRTARISAFLISINVFHLQYSQEARGYAMVVFLALLSCYFFLGLLTSVTRITLAAYVLASILMVYAHVFGLWILLAQWVCALLLPNEVSRKKIVAIAAGIISIFLAPLLFSLLFVSDGSQLSWMKAGAVSSLYHFFLDLGGDAGWSLLVLYIVLMLISLRFHWRTPQLTGARIGYVFLWVWLLLPIFIVGGISLYRPMFQARYVLICLPPFLMLAADGLTRIRSRLVFAAALIALTGMSLIGIRAYYEARADVNHSDNWRDATAYCLAQVRTGDAVLFPYSAEEIPFRAYQNRMGARSPEITLVPEKTDLELLATAGTWASPALAAEAASQNHRVWVITALQPDAHSAAARAALGRRMKEEARRSFGFVTIQLFVPAEREAPGTR